MGFTRTEFAISAVAIILVAAVAIPGLANTRNRSQRATCVDNLRLIGQGVQLWGVDHENNPPWQVNQLEGGTRPRAGFKPAAVWFELSWLSNQLVTPKILVCPSDAIKAKSVADNWGTLPNGGYRSVAYRDNATSYALSVHSSLSNPNSFVFADRNLRPDNFAGATCSLGFNNISSITRAPLSLAAWTNAIHGFSGNLLTADGRVLELPNPDLKSYLDASLTADNGALHLIFP